MPQPCSCIITNIQRPFERSEDANHFAYMIPFEGSTVKGWNIYHNKRCDDSGHNYSDLTEECLEIHNDCTPEKKQTMLPNLSSSEKKKKKQLMLTSFMSRMVVDNENANKLKERQQSEAEYEVLEVRRQVQLILIEIVDKINSSFVGNEEKSKIVTDSCYKHATWEYRALVIAFWIHPFLGNNNYSHF